MQNKWGKNYYEYEAQKVETIPNKQWKTNGGINCPRELYEPEARKIKMVLITYQLQNDHRVAKKHSRAWPKIHACTGHASGIRCMHTQRVLGACIKHTQKVVGAWTQHVAHMQKY